VDFEAAVDEVGDPVSRFTQAARGLPMGIFATSSPRMSSTRSFSSRMPTSIIFLYRATVSRNGAGLAVIGIPAARTGAGEIVAGLADELSGSPTRPSGRSQ
jgi:hypothetical protein